MPPPADMAMALKLVQMCESHHQAMYGKHKAALAMPESRLVTWQEEEACSDSSNEEGVQQDRVIWRAFGAGATLGASLDELCKAVKDGFQKYGDALTRLEDRVSNTEACAMPTPKMVSDMMRELPKTLSGLMVKDQGEGLHRQGIAHLWDLVYVTTVGNPDTGGPHAPRNTNAPIVQVKLGFQEMNKG